LPQKTGRVASVAAWWCFRRPNTIQIKDTTIKASAIAPAAWRYSRRDPPCIATLRGFNYASRMEGKYSIELFRDGDEGAGIEKILVRHDSLTVARALYKVAALNCSERLIMLCDRARVLARSDRPETMPEIRKRPT
jgi:hypothetical protein